MSKMGRGPAAKIDAPRDLPSGIPWVQWRVENEDEIARFLEGFEVRMRPAPGNQLLIQGRYHRWSLQLSPGDCLVLQPASAEYPRERLGLVRVPESAKFRESENPEDFRF
ncbi:MAG: hypothetical protein AMJ84_00015 [Acidithiobacillales bacterium SM23_46]|nr:MAG: hypothetical protein AMJ84_00015 [Acidithiobacillales bacterium SM23_46]KPL28996.1 MAG: hypothetical protein AMJ72_00100 [Acidithiobacillales bacterium SM1_46]